MSLIASARLNPTKIWSQSQNNPGIVILNFAVPITGIWAVTRSNTGYTRCCQPGSPGAQWREDGRLGGWRLVRGTPSFTLWSMLVRQMTVSLGEGGRGRPWAGRGAVTELKQRCNSGPDECKGRSNTICTSTKHIVLGRFVGVQVHRCHPATMDQETRNVECDITIYNTVMSANPLLLPASASPETCICYVKKGRPVKSARIECDTNKE